MKKATQQIVIKLIFSPDAPWDRSGWQHTHKKVTVCEIINCTITIISQQQKKCFRYNTLFIENFNGYKYLISKQKASDIDYAGLCEKHFAKLYT